LHGLASAVIGRLVPGHPLGPKRSKARGGEARKESPSGAGDRVANDDDLSDMKKCRDE